MDYNELEAFVALARYLHFARAASAAQTSPSGLSRLLGRLENELGVRLFERDTRRVELTKQGELFLEFAVDSLYKRDALLLQLKNCNSELEGILRVYASVTACYSILPPFAAALAATYPGIRLSVDTGDPADAEELVRSGKAELAVAALPAKGFSDLDCFSVRRSPLILAAASDGPYGNLELENINHHPAGTTDAQHLKKILAEVPLILPRLGIARERFDSWAAEQGIKPIIAAESEGNEAILALARLGLGLGLVPQLVLEQGPFAAGLTQFSAAQAFGDYDIGFIQRKTISGSETDRRIHAAVRAILEKK